MTSWEEMSFIERKKNAKGHIFIVGTGINTIKASYFLNEPKPQPNERIMRDGELLLDDIVFVLENPYFARNGERFWKVLSRVGIVWCQPDHFSSKF